MRADATASQTASQQVELTLPADKMPTRPKHAHEEGSTSGAIRAESGARYDEAFKGASSKSMARLEAQGKGGRTVFAPPSQEMEEEEAEEGRTRLN